MSDLISRAVLYERAVSLEAQALAYVGKLIERDGEEPSVEWKIWSAILNERTAFKHDVYDAPSAEPERKWIPVSEALPEKKEMVLITNNKGHVKCGQYQGTFDAKNLWWWKHNTLEKVLAWMPLPEPWRGE